MIIIIMKMMIMALVIIMMRATTITTAITTIIKKILQNASKILNCDKIENCHPSKTILHVLRDVQCCNREIKLQTFIRERREDKVLPDFITNNTKLFFR